MTQIHAMTDSGTEQKRENDVFVYGSCVARDTFEFLKDDGKSLIAYVARQSLISAMSDARKPAELLGHSKLTSSFQQGALEGDFNASLRREIVAQRDAIEILLVDLVDERSGVYISTDGAVITNSSELTNSGILEIWQSDHRLVKFGSDEHFKLWTAAFDKFASLLKEEGLIGRLVLIKSRWALESKEGDVFPLPPSKLEPARMNTLYTRYYEYIAENYEAHIIEPPAELCVSTRSHKWGIAPFHYVSSMYRFIQKRIRDERFGV